jgi:TolA-binding protein
MRGPGRRAFAFVVASTVACASAHGAAFVRAMNRADDAAGHGDPLEAARRFDVAASVARSTADRDEARHAAATMLARAHDVRAALARLDALGSEVPAGAETGSSFYDAALLRVTTGDTDAGWRDMERMIFRFPNDGDARPALHHWLTHLDEVHGVAATLSWLRRATPKLDATDRAEEVAYETALRLDETGDHAGARDAFLAVAARWPYPQGALWDDALFHASAIDEALGRARDAAAELRHMLARREHAIILGSSERSRYADAELHLGELYRDKLSDHAEARAAFHALFTDFPESPMRDRGAFEEAKLLAADGDAAAACARLETLVREVPDSRYAPCARLTCPTLRAQPGAGAPHTCHGYIETAR